MSKTEQFSNLWADIIIKVKPDTEYTAKAKRVSQVFDNFGEEPSMHLWNQWTRNNSLWIFCKTKRWRKIYLPQDSQKHHWTLAVLSINAFHYLTCQLGLFSQERGQPWLLKALGIKAGFSDDGDEPLAKESIEADRLERDWDLNLNYFVTWFNIDLFAPGGKRLLTKLAQSELLVISSKSTSSSKVPGVKVFCLKSSWRRDFSTYFPVTIVTIVTCQEGCWWDLLQPYPLEAMNVFFQFCRQLLETWFKPC